MRCMSTTHQNPEIAKLLGEIEAYLAKSGQTRTGFGALVIGDPNLLRDLENGRELRWATITKIRSKLEAAS